eukprot:1312152-Rhodomonas_salina.1
MCGGGCRQLGPSAPHCLPHVRSPPCPPSRTKRRQNVTRGNRSSGLTACFVASVGAFDLRFCLHLEPLACLTASLTHARAPGLGLQAMHTVHDGLPLRNLPRRHPSAGAGPRNRMLDGPALRDAGVCDGVPGGGHHRDALLHRLPHSAPPGQGRSGAVI